MKDIETVKDRTGKLKQSIEQIISDFREETGILPVITVTNKIVGPCHSVVTVYVEEELLPYTLEPRNERGGELADHDSFKF